MLFVLLNDFAPIGLTVLVLAGIVGASMSTAKLSASVAVRYSPSCFSGSSDIRAPEKPWHRLAVRAGQCEQEAAVEEPVGPLARCLRGERAAVACRSVQEVLGVVRSSHGAHRVR